MDVSKLLEQQVVLLEKQQELNELMDKYKTDCKAMFGIADGEPLNILQIVSLIQKVVASDKA